MTVSRVRVLAITHIVVGALLIIFGVADGVTTSSERGDIEFVAGDGFFGVWIGIWVSVHCRNSSFVRYKLTYSSSSQPFCFPAVQCNPLARRGKNRPENKSKSE